MMITARIAVYLLIISYILPIGHNFIPHHHHHQDQEHYNHVNHHHAPSGGEDNNDHDHDTDSFPGIFSNMLHHDDDGLFIQSTSSKEYKIVTPSCDFGLCNENSVFGSLTSLKRKKHPPENHSWFKLHHFYSYGLRAPPAFIA
ncbi:MAG: hypothetical protein H7X99_07885 [Saprospiraceae bacterium]|nr:hypothetical protein [Saprospiraceae bacterium]